MWTRRQFVSRGVLGLLGAGGVSMAMSGDGPKDAADKSDPQEALPDGSASKDMITPQTDRAIERGLSYLAARQHADGSFGTNGYQGNVAVTSLAALAFMAGGSQPNRGPYGKEVTRALTFVLSQENRDGRHPPRVRRRRTGAGRGASRRCPATAGHRLLGGLLLRPSPGPPDRFVLCPEARPRQAVSLG